MSRMWRQRAKAQGTLPVRHRAQPINRRIVLGPVPCQGCGSPVTWNGYAWEGEDGIRHVCSGRTMMSSGGTESVVASLRPGPSLL